MKNVFETVINKGGFDLGKLLQKIDRYHVDGKLTDQELESLYQKARAAAKPESGVDVYAKLAELDGRVRRLESGVTDDGETTAEYVPGKWYRSGDRVTFNGTAYTCTAPEGVVCTWSPAEYPAHWEAAV